MEYLWIITLVIAILVAGYTWWKTKSLGAVRDALRTALPALRIIAKQTKHTEIDDNLVGLIERMVGDADAEDS